MPPVKRPLELDYALGPDGQRYEILGVEDREHDDYYTVRVACGRGYLLVRVGVVYSSVMGAWLPYEGGWFVRTEPSAVDTILDQPTRSPEPPRNAIASWYVARRMLFLAGASLLFYAACHGV